LGLGEGFGGLGDFGLGFGLGLGLGLGFGDFGEYLLGELLLGLGGLGLL
jgi:hypothetical protein